MKLKLNKACDLASISVLPPQSRRMSGVQHGSQPSQLRSQPSQQSFSQGFSSQHGVFSQLSQTSMDEAFTIDQRLNSQELDNCVKKASSLPPTRRNSQEQDNHAQKASSLPPTSYSRGESQLPISRSSGNLMNKWNHGSEAETKSCRMSEELECRLVTMETSLKKFGMMLDSVQSDIMQVNKGTKEVLLEMEGIRQKVLALDTSLLTMNKGLGDVKSTLDGSLKSMSEQLNKDAWQNRIHEIFFLLSALPGQMEDTQLKLQEKLRATCVQDMQAMICSLRIPNLESPHLALLPPKDSGSPSHLESKPGTLEIKGGASKMSAQATEIPREETLGWKSVKREGNAYSRRSRQEEQNHQLVSQIEPASSSKQERGHGISIDSDEEIDGGLSCLIDPKEPGTGNYMMEEVKAETERILRKARRRKRKSCLPIIIE